MRPKKKLLAAIAVPLLALQLPRSAAAAPPATAYDFDVLVAQIADAPELQVAAALPTPAPVNLALFTNYNVIHLVWELHGVTDLATHIKIDCVIRYESTWNQYARSRTSDSGYFQINDIHKWRWAWEDGYLDIFDPWLNSEIAYQIWAERGGNFNAWSAPARYC